jgi:hypothetical protein
LVDAWRTNNRVTMFLIEQLPADLWSVPVPGAPRRTVRMVAAHLHNSRCRWIRALGGRHGWALAVDEAEPGMSLSGFRDVPKYRKVALTSHETAHGPA